MNSTHRIIYESAADMRKLPDQSVQLVVTSPPYPMIEMWDECFRAQNPSIEVDLNEGQGHAAFDKMHFQLNRIWQELWRVCDEGAIVCINIGDATRTLNGEFQLYSNHSRIVNDFLKLGFSNLPGILWRKPTNAPNKFMGSGTLAPGAYVTLEHEHVLIFRKGNKRIFKKSEMDNRRASAFFWEERNQWFSDVWTIKGVRQSSRKGLLRDRTAAYPYELAYRLINMFSVFGDTVLDPFVGTGTTALAAAAAARNSIGFELDDSLQLSITERFTIESIASVNSLTAQRLESHLHFIEERKLKKGEDAFKHHNAHYDMPVMTRQERELQLQLIKSVSLSNSDFVIEHQPCYKLGQEQAQGMCL